jgi:hypothetical protein
MHIGVHPRVLGLLAFGLGLAGCASPPAPRPLSEAMRVEAGREFAMSPGDVAVLGDRRRSIVFAEMVEDSRCPPTVTCVWEGNARLRFSFRSVNRAPERKVVDGQFELNTSGRFAKSADLEYLRIELVKLAPATAAPNRKYVATLRFDVSR